MILKPSSCKVLLTCSGKQDLMKILASFLKKVSKVTNKSQPASIAVARWMQSATEFQQIHSYLYRYEELLALLQVRWSSLPRHSLLSGCYLSCQSQRPSTLDAFGRAFPRSPTSCFCSRHLSPQKVSLSIYLSNRCSTPELRWHEISIAYGGDFS